MCSLLCAVSLVTQPGAVGGRDFKGVKTLPQPSPALSYGLVLWGARREALQKCGGFLAPSLAGRLLLGEGRGLSRPSAPVASSLPTQGSDHTGF